MTHVSLRFSVLRWRIFDPDSLERAARMVILKITAVPFLQGANFGVAGASRFNVATRHYLHRNWPAGSLLPLHPCGWPIFQFHAKRQSTRGQDFLDLVQRLASEVRRLQQFVFSPLDQITDVINV